MSRRSWTGRRIITLAVVLLTIGALSRSWLALLGCGGGAPNYSNEIRLTIAFTGKGSFTVASTGNAAYVLHQIIGLADDKQYVHGTGEWDYTAIPAAGWSLANWGGDCAAGGTTPTYRLIQHQGLVAGVITIQCTATFVQGGPPGDGGVATDGGGSTSPDMAVHAGSCPAGGLAVDMGCNHVPLSSRKSGTSNALYGVATTASGYVAVGDKGTLLTSSDGKSWTTGSFGALSSNAFQSVAVGATATNKFVAIGTSVAGVGGFAAYSPDGVTWTQATGTGAPASAFKVIWNGSQYLTIGSGAEICTSPTAPPGPSRPAQRRCSTAPFPDWARGPARNMSWSDPAAARRSSPRRPTVSPGRARPASQRRPASRSRRWRRATR